MLLFYILLVTVVAATRRQLRWVGDVWLPPNGKLYSIPEIQKTFENRRVLIIGDSLSRRLTSTLSLILNDEDGSDLLDKEIDNPRTLFAGGHGQKEWPVPCGRLMFKWAPLAKDVGSYVNRTNLSNFTDIIVAIGVHDAEDGTVSLEEAVYSAINAFADAKQTIVWRTAPNMDQPRNKEYTDKVNGRVHAFNSIVLNATNHKIRIVDTASTLSNKSVGKERLRGDSPEHFGNIARMVEIQTIVHELSL